jgi:hypothetical protein
MKLFAIFFLLIALSCIGFSARAEKSDLQFTDVKKQTEEFIGYYKTIQLTSDQEEIKTEALKVMPAACCSQFSQATCCCVCNLSRSVWGLSKYLIAKKNYDALKVRAAVQKWIDFTHPKGYAGDSCPSRRCGLAFHKDGCGGMGEQVVYE